MPGSKHSIGSKHSNERPRFGYPVVLDVHGVSVLVVGGGPVAARKVAGLAAAGAEVRVVAADVSGAMRDEVDAGHVVELTEREYRPDDIAGARLVVTATGVAAVDAAVAADATTGGVWVNAADRPDNCSFILPAIARNGPLTIAVSTDGLSPALGQRLREQAAALVTDDVVQLAERLAARRAEIKAAGGSTEDHDWEAEIEHLGLNPESGQG